MSYVVSIKTRGDQQSQFVIHPERAAKIGFDVVKFAFVSFGTLKHYVKIRQSPKVSPEEVVLSENVTKALHLPDYPIYEVAVNQNELIIGPYIGLLLSSEDRRFTMSRLHKTMVYLKNYAQLHGAVVVFALNKVDKKNRLLEGYCYNPIKKCWQKGMFPYPASIYRTIGLSAEWKNHFFSALGNKIFNNRFFNKWEMYEWFSKDPEINSHLPYTVLYHSAQDVLEMLHRFPKIYVKPVFGLEGRGIVRISADNKSLIIKSRARGEEPALTFEDPVKAAEYIRQRFRSGRHIVQQAIDLLEYQGRLIDFRCVVQKNQANAWVCRAIVGRSGVKNSIVSNISSGGTAFTAETILRRALPEPAANIEDIRAKITALALSVSNKLDGYGINCGTLGLDIGVDRQGRLWLIEINNRDPDPSIALDLGNVQLFYTLKTGPLFYAKYLAGFKEP